MLPIHPKQRGVVCLHYPRRVEVSKTESIEVSTQPLPYQGLQSGEEMNRHGAMGPSVWRPPAESNAPKQPNHGHQGTICGRQ